MQNLRYYCKERIEALADKQCKFGCIYIYQVRFEHIVQSANKISYNSLTNLESYWNLQGTIIHIFLLHEGNVWIL